MTSLWCIIVAHDWNIGCFAEFHSSSAALGFSRCNNWQGCTVSLTGQTCFLFLCVQLCITRDTEPVLHAYMYLQHSTLDTAYTACSFYPFHPLILTCHCTLHIKGQGNCYSVLLLSPEDGQQNVIAATKNICNSVMQRNLKTSEIDTALVNKTLSGTQSCIIYTNLLQCVEWEGVQGILSNCCLQNVYWYVHLYLSFCSHKGIPRPRASHGVWRRAQSTWLPSVAAETYRDLVSDIAHPQLDTIHTLSYVQ